MSNTIDEMLEIMNNARKDSCSNLTIGKALKQLKELDENMVVEIDQTGFQEYFKDCRENEYEADNEEATFYFKKTWDSYRGYYEDLMLEISTEEEKDYTVKDYIELLEQALQKGMMYGYKGGVYKITENTILWLDEYGRAKGVFPFRFMKIDKKVILLTSWCR